MSRLPRVSSTESVTASRAASSRPGSESVAGGEQLAEHGLDVLLLTADPVEVAARQAVALPEVPAGPVAVEVVDAGRERVGDAAGGLGDHDVDPGRGRR
jgi:hypothetical protein